MEDMNLRTFFKLSFYKNELIFYGNEKPGYDEDERFFFYKNMIEVKVFPGDSSQRSDKFIMKLLPGPWKR